MEITTEKNNIDDVDNRIRINIDFDDVMNNLTTHWREVHEEATGEDLDFTRWNLHEISKFGTAIYDYFGLPDFFETALPNNGLQKLFRFLMHNGSHFSYKIVSHCTGKAKENYDSVLLQKSNWIKEYLDETVLENFILTDEPKSKWEAEIIIDDKIDNLVDCKASPVLVLMRAPHNRVLSVENVKYDYGIDIHIVDSLNEFVELLEDIRDKGIEYYMEDNGKV